MKLSVCIPVYNVAAYIEKCARSLFEQTYADIEYIFVDDSSPDDSVSIVERALKDYPARTEQVRILRLEGNHGSAVARKTAVDAATGDLIAFCDADDWVDPELYEKMVAQLVSAHADAVMCPVRFESSSGSVLRGRTDVFRVSGVEALRNMEDYPGFSSLVLRIVRRELLDPGYEIPDGLHLAEDLCLSVQLLTRCRLLTNVTSGPVYHYRQNEASLSHTADAALVVSDHRRVYDVLVRRIPADVGAAVCRHLARTVLYWGTTHGLFNGDEYRHWRSVYVSLGGLPGSFDTSPPCGWLMMKLADRCFFLSRLIAPFVRRRIHDSL